MSKPVNEPTTLQVIVSLFAGGFLCIAGLFVAGYFSALYLDSSKLALPMYETIGTLILGAVMFGAGFLFLSAPEERLTRRKFLGVALFVAAIVLFFGCLIIFGIDAIGPLGAFLLFCLICAIFCAGVFLFSGKDETKESELYNARKESARAAIEELCQHLRRMGSNATVESTVCPFPQWGIIGSVRVANRNIDLIEIDWAEKAVGEYQESSIDVYRCNYVVQAKVDSLEDKLRAYTKPVTSFFRVIDFEWKGKELAQVLNSDADIRRTLYMLIVKHRGHSADRPALRVEPNREDQCIRIGYQRFSYSPKAAFPSIEALEVFDRIAQHVRSIAKVSACSRL